jgi:hypothetical protein
MNVCYNKLFKLLIDKGMKKTDLRKMTGISPKEKRIGDGGMQDLFTAHVALDVQLKIDNRA